MRYTRYNYNKRRGGRRNNKNNFLPSFMIIVVLASVLGILVGKFVVKEGSIPISKPDEEVVDNNNSNDEEEVTTNTGVVDSKEVYFLQCGVFSTKESSESVLQTLPNDLRGFTIKEDEKYKAMVGVFSPEEVEDKAKALKDAGINNMKVKFRIDVKDDNDQVKIEILNGYTNILTQFNDSKTQAIKSEEFKKWIAENEGKISSQDEEIKVLIEGIKNLPETIDKSIAIEINKKIYDILKKYRV